MKHEQKDILMTMPIHAGKIIAPKNAESILKQADISAEEFETLL